MKNPSNWEIRIFEAKLQNLKDLTDIAYKSFLQAYPQNTDHENMALYLEKAFDEKEINNQLSNPASIFFLMTVNDELSGYAKLRWDRSPEQLKSIRAVELERLYFLNDFKGKGLGSQLLEYCIKFSMGKEFEIMWLLVWDENISGIEFYKHKGFETFAHKVFHFGNDSSEDILMKLEL